MRVFCDVMGIDMVVKEGSSRAYFNPGRNSITVPSKSQYSKENIAEYYSTCLHEISHADLLVKMIAQDAVDAIFTDQIIDLEKLVWLTDVSDMKVFA